jgi:hypothetical protein
MLRLVETYPHAVPPLMRAMTDYFATFALHTSGFDLYSQLLRRLSKDALTNTLFSSLNYECLLETAASISGCPVEYGDAPLTSRAVRVWKLHGSCNFLPDGIQMQGVDWGGPIQIEGGIRVVDAPTARQWVQGNTSLYAAMCLYTVDKPIQIGASLITALQTEWGRLVRGAETVVVIGTRPHDQDRHLWEPLAEARGDLYFCGAHQSFYGWLRRCGRATTHSHFAGSTFEDALPLIADVLNA